MQDVGGVGLEPLHVSGPAAPRQHREPGRHVAVQSRDVRVVLEEFGIPEQRKVVENHVILGERHIVRQPGPGQLDIDVVDQRVVLVDHSVMQVRCVLAVVEEQQLSGGVVDLRVRRYTQSDWGPVLFAQGVAGVGVDPIQVATLVEAAERDTAVHGDIGAGGVLHQGACTPAVVALGELHRLGDPGPQRAGGLVLGQESVGADEPVAIACLSVPKVDDVQHAVTVERMVGLERGVQRVLGVAQIHPVQVGRDLTLDDRQVVGVPFAGLRPPGAGAVGVIVVRGQGGCELGDQIGVHRTSWDEPTTKLTVVAVLPPKFRVPNVFAPSTW